jgi:signal transduction histidine kinase
MVGVDKVEDATVDTPRVSPSRGAWPLYFFQEAKAYINFSDEDAARLAALHDVVEPNFPAIVDAFYAGLNSNPRTRAVFDSPEQLDRLRISLHRWLEELFTGPYDAAYFDKRLKIGRRHVDVGLLPHFMFGAMSIIRSHISGLLQEHFTDTEARLAHVRSVDRILDLELTIMLQSYWDNMMELKLKIPTALATGLAHEIRNPLNAINLNLTLLERRIAALEDGDATTGPIIEGIRGEIRRIGSLTNEIMDFAKPIDILPAWHDANVLVTDLATVHGPTLDASNIEFETRVEGEPEIWCDLDRITQILVNLITNAVQAIEDEGRVTLSIINGEVGTEIVVSDDGEGMPPALKYRIFDIFFTTKAGGTGLGLPISRKIVEAHDGAMDVTSKQGRGTTFTIFLPRPPK